MNYYPYYMGIPYTTLTPITRGGGIRSLLGGIKWSSILNGTQKTLGIVNQAIPIIKQAGPVINNAKTMFRVMSEFKKIDSLPQTNIVNENKQTEQSANDINKSSEKANYNQNGPIFFQ